jgi:membrane protein DedA with SNARE-associated domain
MGAGVVLAFASMALGLSGWPLTRLWLWQLLGAMSILVGVQLLIGWFIMRVLEELSQRQEQVDGDMRGGG